VKTSFPHPRLIAIMTISFLATLALSGLVVTPSSTTTNGPPRGVPQLSSIALFSRFTKDNGLGAADLSQLLGADEAPDSVAASPSSLAFLAAPNNRPQNEPSVAVKATDATNWVTGTNDYGIGAPIGGGVYTKTSGALQTYLTPFPLLAAKGGSGSPVLLEAPIATGDPVVVFSNKISRFFYSSLGLSATFCENGIFVFRSLDSSGSNWRRSIVPPLFPPSGLGTVTYYDSGQNCSVLNDKEWMTVDNDPASPYYGRVYVTWTRFNFPSHVYKSSPIMLAYSDDNGNTFSSPIEINGASTAFCRTLVNGAASTPNPKGVCDENQFSVPVVGPDHDVYVAFENQQFNGAADGFRDQYLVVKVDSGTFSVTGPFKVDPGTAGGTFIDGGNDYPINQDGRQTVCGSNFRLNSAGNLAVDLLNGNLYVVWSDDRSHADEFPFPTSVGPRTSSPATSYVCPSGRNTDTDVFLSSSNIASLASWSTPLQVNQDKPPGSTNNKDQWFPWVAVDASTHNVYVVYHDRQYDSLPIPNKFARTSLATSTDLGSTFTTKDIQGFASNFDNAFFGAGNFIGDYNNVVFSSGQVYAAFTVVQSGKTDSDVAVYVGT